jgi:aminopeptidase YwaD
MTGTFAYLAKRSLSKVAEDEGAPDRGRPQWLAGLNLDMVGADQERTGGQWELVDLPQAAASFADHLLAALREPFLGNVRHTETTFSAGSDHYILSDPTVGIPAPMLIHWPDKFYHTSEDTPEKVSPDSLARSGALTAVYAYWLATAGAAEAEWLGHWMVSRFTTWAGRAASEIVEVVRGAATGAERQAAWVRYHKTNSFRTERMRAALAQLTRIDPGIASRLASWSERIAGAAADEERWAAAAVEGLIRIANDGPASSPGASWQAEAARLTPDRIFPGPIDVSMNLQADRPDLLPRLWALNEVFGQVAYDYEPVLQYWADGKHTVAEIGELAWLELGRQTDEHTLAYFKLLAEAELLGLRNTDAVA